jgi:dephospho-CoA kinase
MKRIIIFSGLSGSGKTTAAEYFSSKNIPVLRMGELTQKILTKEKRTKNEESESVVRDHIRKELGDTVYAQSILPDVSKILKEHDTIVIEGMRSIAEWGVFKTVPVSLFVVFLHSRSVHRTQRLAVRKTRPLSIAEMKKRDTWEKRVGTAKIQKIADKVVGNDGSKEQFLHKLENIYHFILKPNDTSKN